MPTRRKLQPIKLEEWFVVLNGCVPLVMMLLDAKHHRLGVDPIRASLHITGSLAIGTLLLTLAVTPVRVMTLWKKVILHRRPLGLMSFVYAMTHRSIFVAHDQQWDWSATLGELRQHRYSLICLISLLPLALASTPTMIGRLGLSSLGKAAPTDLSGFDFGYRSLRRANQRQPLLAHRLQRSNHCLVGIFGVDSPSQQSLSRQEYLSMNIRPRRQRCLGRWNSDIVCLGRTTSSR